MGAPVESFYDQYRFRFRNNDGNETTATWREAQDTNITMPIDTEFRLRAAVVQTVSAANQNLTKSFKLRYGLNGGAYTDIAPIGSTNNPVRYANASPGITDGQFTTQQLTQPTLGTYLDGRIDNDNLIQNLTFNIQQYTELEFIIELYGPLLTTGNTLTFRVYETNDTALNNYTVSPVATVTTGRTGELSTQEQAQDRSAILYQATSIITPFATAQGAGSVLLTWGVNPDYGVYD